MLTIGIIALLVTVGLSGCEQSENKTKKETFVGIWQSTTTNITRTITLLANNSCSLSTLKGSSNFSTLTGTWEIKDEKFIMKFPNPLLIYTFNYSFSNNDRTLTLTSAYYSSTTQEFTKQQESPFGEI